MAEVTQWGSLVFKGGSQDNLWFGVFSKYSLWLGIYLRVFSVFLRLFSAFEDVLQGVLCG